MFGAALRGPCSQELKMVFRGNSQWELTLSLIAWDTPAPANNSQSELRDESLLTEPQVG